MKIYLLNLFFCYLLIFINSLIAEQSSNDLSLYFKDGVHLEHSPSNFKTQLRFRMQNRFTYESKDTNDLEGESAEFTVRRLRLRMEGHVLDPRLIYRMQFSFTRGDMDYDRTEYPHILRDAAVGWKFSDDSIFYFGQMKLPGNRQRVISSGRLQLVDRSIVNATFNIDRDLGAQYHYKFFEDKPVWLKLSISNGEGRSSTNINSGLAYTSRLEFYPLGNFTERGEDFEGDLVGESAPKLGLGVTYSTNRNTNKTGGQIGKQWDEDSAGTRDINTLLADLLFKYRYFSILTEYANRKSYSGDNFISQQGNEYTIYNGQGYMIQAGYFVTDHWETSFRYSIVDADSITLRGENDQQQYTLGLSRYFKQHLIKWQSDITVDQQQNNLSNLDEENFIFRTQLEIGI